MAMLPLSHTHPYILHARNDLLGYLDGVGQKGEAVYRFALVNTPASKVRIRSSIRAPLGGLEMGKTPGKSFPVI